MLETKIPHAQYAYANAGLMRDTENRLRRTGEAEIDGKISISEMINAMAKLKVVIGEELNLRKNIFEKDN